MSNYAICKQQTPRALATLLPLLQHLSKGFAVFKQGVSLPTSIPSFLVPRKVRFLAMTMFWQARHRSFGLAKTLLLYNHVPNDDEW